MTVLITGATSGIGKQTALKLATLGYRVVLLSRDHKKLKDTRENIIQQTKNEKVSIIRCDLSSQEEIRIAAREINKKYPKIDVLINNAGIVTSRFEKTVDGIEKTFAVNHFAPFLLTGLLLDNLKRAKQGRVINVSSGGHKKVRLDIDKLKANQYQGSYLTYRRSKLANVMFTIDLARLLKNTRITVNTLHPGLIKTNIGTDDPTLMRKFVNFVKEFVAESPEQGIDTIIYLATAERVKCITGKYFVNKKITKPAKDAYNEHKRKALWKLSEAKTDFYYG